MKTAPEVGRETVPLSRGERCTHCITKHSLVDEQFCVFMSSMLTIIHCNSHISFQLCLKNFEVHSMQEVVILYASKLIGQISWFFCIFQTNIKFVKKERLRRAWNINLWFESLLRSSEKLQCFLIIPINPVNFIYMKKHEF